MKKLVFSFFILGIAISIQAQDDTQSFDHFKQLEASTSVEVELIASNEHKAEIWIEDGDLEELVVDQFGSRLKIYWKERGKIWRGNNHKRKATIKLYYTELNGIDVAAGGKVFGADVIKADDFEAEASSGGHMKIQVEANMIDVDVSSGGWAQLKGTTDKLTVEASSGGSFKGEDMKASNVRAKASSGGNAKVWATDSIEASASSGGNVRYKGNPSRKDISSSKWSGGSVKNM